MTNWMDGICKLCSMQTIVPFDGDWTWISDGAML
jgi:hypothetical protein